MVCAERALARHATAGVRCAKRPVAFAAGQRVRAAERLAARATGAGMRGAEDAVATRAERSAGKAQQRRPRRALLAGPNVIGALPPAALRARPQAVVTGQLATRRAARQRGGRMRRRLYAGQLCACGGGRTPGRPKRDRRTAARCTARTSAGSRRKSTRHMSRRPSAWQTHAATPERWQSQRLRRWSRPSPWPALQALRP